MFRNRKLTPVINYEEICKQTPKISIGSLYKSSGTRIDCALLASRTKWGKLNSNDAAILYLAIGFSPPENHELRKATVLIRFCTSSSEKTQSTQDTSCPNIIEHHPTKMRGPLWSRHVSWSGSLDPTVEAAGVSVGLGHIDRSIDQTEAYGWFFNGETRNTGQGHFYNLLECQWHPQRRGDYLPEHRIVKLGVVLRHYAESFFLKSSLLDLRIKSFEKRGSGGYRHLMLNTHMAESAPEKTVQMPAKTIDTDLQQEREKLRHEIEKDNLKDGDAFFPCGQSYEERSLGREPDLQPGGSTLNPVSEPQPDVVMSDILEVANTAQALLPQVLGG